MQRRTLLKASLTAAAALSLPLSVRSAFAAEPFTFYGLKSMSGAFASYGKFADMGSRLAVQQHPDLLGRPPDRQTAQQRPGDGMSGQPTISPRLGAALFIAAGAMWCAAAWLSDQLAFYGVGAMFVILGLANLSRQGKDEPS